jgi:hypothetical protein
MTDAIKERAQNDMEGYRNNRVTSFSIIARSAKQNEAIHLFQMKRSVPHSFCRCRYNKVLQYLFSVISFSLSLRAACGAAIQQYKNTLYI